MFHDQLNKEILALNLSRKMQKSDLKICIFKFDQGFLSDESDKQIKDFKFILVVYIKKINIRKNIPSFVS